MAVYLVRHGETNWNIEHRFQGQRDIPLNENGLAQAEQTGRALEGVRFAAVYSSPLSRAVRTARIIAAHTGGAPVEIEERFVERSFGELEGLTVPEGQAYLQAHGGDGGQESKAHAGARMVEGILEKLAQHPGEDILVVSHGSATCCTLLQVTDGELEISGYDIPNGGISRLVWDGQHWKVQLYGVAPGAFRVDLPDMPYPPRQPPENTV